MSGQEQEALVRRFFNRPQTVAAAGTLVLDTRGCRGMTAILDDGTATYQACDEDGVVIDGSVEGDFTSETMVDVAWPFYLITATTAACVVATIA
jgi:hypothetical protein